VSFVRFRAPLPVVQRISSLGGVGPYNYFVTGVNGYSNSELNNLEFLMSTVAFNI
jgi:hypothetical protein